MLKRKAEIAVVEIAGPIGGTVRPGEFGRLLRRLREDRKTKAVILEIDSPGGSAVASDYLYLALRRLAAKKPVVAFVRGSGASGAYYLACAASRIIATPAAIIGSIGVISVRPVVVDLLDRIGVRVSVSKTGPLKDMGAPYRELTPEEREKEEQLIGRFFDRFVEIVAEARNMSAERVRELATGEVYIGADAKDRGLVDETGDFDRALEVAADLGQTRPQFQYARPHRPLLARIMAPAGAAMAQHLTYEIESRLQRQVLYQARGRPPRRDQ